MSELNDIIINLVDLTQGITRQGFGLPLLYTPVSDVAYVEYGSLASLKEASPALDADIIAMAEKLFAQEPIIEKCAVYGVDNTMDKGKGTATAGTSSSITLAADTSKADDFFNAGILYIYAGKGAGQWRVISAFVGSTNVASVSANFSITPDDTSKYAIFNASTIAGAIEDDFEALSLDGDMNWYFLLSNVRTSTTCPTTMPKQLSLTADTYKKMYVVEFNNETAVNLTANTDAIAFASASANGGDSDRVVVMVTDKFQEYIDCALIGRMATFKPAGATWKFKNLTRISGTAFKDGDVANMHAGFVNTYVTKFGVKQTSEGLTTSSKKVFADIRILKDYITARMSEDIGQMFINTPKIPYDASGIQKVASVLEGCFGKFYTEGLIAIDETGMPLYTLIMPKLSSIDSVDKANRKLTGITFTATLAGAIHKVEITGYLVL